MRWYLDGELTFTVNADQVPAQTWASLSDHAGYFIILNVAMGGAFPNKAGIGGGPTAATKPGVPMVVDYVEVKYAAGRARRPPRRRPPRRRPPRPRPPRRAAPTATTSDDHHPADRAAAPPARPTCGSPATTDSTSPSSWNGSAGGSYDVLRSGQRIATVTGHDASPTAACCRTRRTCTRSAAAGSPPRC